MMVESVTRIFSEILFVILVNLMVPRREQSLANSSALITDIRRIRFSALLSGRRKNEILSLESVMVLGAFTGKRVKRMYSRLLFYAVRMKSWKHQDRRCAECILIA